MCFPTLVSSGFLLNEIALPISCDDVLFDYTANWNWNVNDGVTVNVNDHVTVGACFTAGMQIVVGAEFTEDNVFVEYVTVNIEDIEIGDLVYSYDTVTGIVSQQEVTATFARESDHINYLTFIDESGNEQVIETTDSHPFWVVTDSPDLERAARSVVDENGVTLYHENLESGLYGFWVEAKYLQAGDVFLGANGELSTLVISERVVFPDGVKVYNFTVAGNHNYFVLAEVGDYGQTSILVHNAKNYEHQLSAEHIKAAKIEKDGGVVARKQSGEPFDHLTETREAMNGAVNEINRIKRKLAMSNLTAKERIILEGELSRLSILRDRARRILDE